MTQTVKINTYQNSEPKWFAFRVPPQKELRAAKILRDAGFDAVVPVVRKWRRKNRFQKVRTITQYPLMYGYVLMRFEDNVPWFKLFSYSFMQGVVGFNGQPASLDPGQVGEILNDEQRGKFSDDDLFQNMKTHGEYQKGDTVHVFAGGMDGLKGKVLNVTKHSATIQVPMFNSRIQMTVPLDGAVRAA